MDKSAVRSELDAAGGDAGADEDARKTRAAVLGAQLRAAGEEA